MRLRGEENAVISGLILGVLMVLVVPLILRIFPEKEIGPVEGRG